MNEWFVVSFQFQNLQGCRLLSSLRWKLFGLDVHEDQGQGLPALRQVRVHSQEVVHARHRLHLQQVRRQNQFRE